MYKGFNLSLVVILVFIFFAGCSSATSSTSTGSGTTGVLELRISDDPAAQDIDRVEIVLQNIQIRKANGDTVPINYTSEPVNLTEIEESEKVLASQTVDAGDYTQVQFTIDSVTIGYESQTYNAVLDTSTFGLAGKFHVTAGQTTIVVMDFEADESILVSGVGQYAFHPVVRLLLTNPGDMLAFGVVKPINGQVNLYYKVQIHATGGKDPVTWSLDSGTLPPGITLNKDNGVLSGKPIQAGSYDISINVTDSSNPPQTIIGSSTIRIVPENDPVIVSTAVADGLEGTPYAAYLNVYGITPYQFSIVSGSLPPGIVIEPYSGLISGVPTASGDFDFSVKFTDSSPSGLSDVQDFTLYIME